MKKKGVIVSGYFNSIHKGHLEYFNNVKALADELFIIVNNDHQRALKGSKEFQNEEERMIIVSNIKAVDHVKPSVRLNFSRSRFFLEPLLSWSRLLNSFLLLYSPRKRATMKSRIIRFRDYEDQQIYRKPDCQVIT